MRNSKAKGYLKMLYVLSAFGGFVAGLAVAYSYQRYLQAEAERRLGLGAGAPSNMPRIPITEARFSAECPPSWIPTELRDRNGRIILDVPPAKRGSFYGLRVKITEHHAIYLGDLVTRNKEPLR
jgi:hypothetical protein